MKILKHLFDNNRKWAERRVIDDPEFFSRLTKQQNPEYLWIGCSDSRVPANEIVGLLPGELFVHRNIANLVIKNDLNCQSVIQFAVEVLKVKHIIVCGHYGCGGVHVSLDHPKLGLVDGWVKHIKEIYLNNEKELKHFNYSVQLSKLCELNVIRQVYNVCTTDAVMNAWQNRQELYIHGWIYDIKDGLLNDLDVCVTSPSEINSTTETAIKHVLS